MKKIAFAALTILLAAACGSKDEKTVTKAEGIDFDSVTVDTIVPLVNVEGSPTAHIHLSLTFVKGDKAEALNKAIKYGGFFSPDYMGELHEKTTLKEAADSFVVNYVKDYQRNYAPLYRGDQQHKTAYDVTYDAHTYVQNHRSGIVCYIAKSNMYGGGEHSVSSTVAKNIDLKTGKAITLNEVFTPGFEQPLAEIITNKLCKEQGVKTLKELQEKGVFTGIEPYASDNFILGDGEVTFIYVDSEIAPHEMGEVRVTLSNDELENVLK